MGQAGGNSSNAIAANVDLGGGTQVVRVSAQGQFSLNSALIFTGNLSNGSLLKTIGYSFNGVQATADGMSLFGNNTYTGSTVLNGGNCVLAGTNATSRIEIVGAFGAAGASSCVLFGGGMAQSAMTIQAFAGGNFVLDNNAASGNSSQIFGPAVAAAQNNDRINDAAEIQLRDGNFIYRGKASTAASETWGNLNVLAGNNVVTITPGATGGVATLTASGNLTMGSRATLQLSTGSLGNQAKLFVNGTIPAADSTGILPRIVGTNDFVTYNGATGMTPYTGYATDFSTPGTNVAITAATAVASSVNINALKRTGSFTLTINSGQTLGITSGMILNTSGTGTITGGTVDFGPKPGVLFGTNNIQSAVTGSDGIIFAAGTGTLGGNASGLTGTMDVYSGTANVNTNTFTGPMKVRNAFLNLNVSQNQASAGAITLGAPENDVNLVTLLPTLSVSGAGANSVFNNNIIVDNGSKTVAGVATRYSFLPGISVLSNSTGTQTFNGNVTLNTGLRVQGGGASSTSTGATVFAGNISGSDQIYVANGRVVFSGQYSNAGGFGFGDAGFTAKGIFTGTPVGSAPIQLVGGSSSSNPTSVAYNNGSLPTGQFRVWNSAGSVVTSIIPLQNSTINNTIFLDNSLASSGGDVNANVGSGIVANWNGPLTGGGGLIKSGLGQLVLGNASNTQTGTVAVNAGILSVNGFLPSSSTTVNSGGTLGGKGTLSGPVTITSGGTVSPGNSIDTLSIGNLNLSGTLLSEINMNNGLGGGGADLLNVTGSVSLSGATLNLALSNMAGIGTYIIVANDGADPVSGTFSSITGVPPGDYTASVNYAFTGTDSLGRVGDGNDIAVTLVPEPSALGLALAGLAAVRRRRRAVI
jgi:autotransporter-associated beta strand protein